ncbi:hypothetical protein SNEBB_001610 [Seison nebaliae]|nr:hypothetical protein SNEBB_001610 [Seison nebaliae]
MLFQFLILILHLICDVLTIIDLESFVFSCEKKSFNDAQLHCQSNNTFLLSNVELDTINSLLNCGRIESNTHLSFWLDGRANGNGTFEWRNSNETISWLYIPREMVKENDCLTVSREKSGIISFWPSNCDSSETHSVICIDDISQTLCEKKTKKNLKTFERHINEYFEYRDFHRTLSIWYLVATSVVVLIAVLPFFLYDIVNRRRVFL